MKWYERLSMKWNEFTEEQYLFDKEFPDHCFKHRIRRRGGFPAYEAFYGCDECYNEYILERTESRRVQDVEAKAWKSVSR